MNDHRAAEVLAAEAAYQSVRIDRFPEHPHRNSWKRLRAALRRGAAALAADCGMAVDKLEADAEAGAVEARQRHAAKAAAGETARFVIELPIVTADLYAVAAGEAAMSVRELMAATLTAAVEKRAA
ncbi:MAG TPA: hypothetical protein VFU14_20280 [Acidimicrobiales bacterium]|nr:hypothetical protein [Acidimicrobiales bacterium]